MEESNAKISIISDYQNFIGDVMSNKYILDNYTFGSEGLTSTKEKTDKFMADLEELNVNKHTFQADFYETNIQIEDKDRKYLVKIRIEQTDDSYISIFAADVDTHKRIFDLFKKYQERSNSITIGVANYFLDGHKLSKTYKHLKLDELSDESESYYPYIDTQKLFKEFNSAKENILLVTGAPGSGKTKLVNLYKKYIINNPPKYLLNKEEFYHIYDGEIPVAYVKSEEVLASEAFWKEAEARDFALIILDDMDNLFAPRASQGSDQVSQLRKSFLSHFLSYTDGVVKNNTKFIITTNTSYKEFDSAVIRAGRAFDILEFRPLKKEEAFNIWKDAGLKKAAFDKTFENLDTITAAELGSEIHANISADSSGVSRRSYLNEDGVSVLTKYKNKQNKIKL